MEYKKFLVKQQTYDGTTYTDVSSVIDVYTEYGIVCQEFPFNYLAEPKEFAKRDWNDEHGEDVYIPADGPKYQAMDLTVKFLYSGSPDEMRSKVVSFINFITGHGTGLSVILAIYDEYTGIGLQGVFVKNISNDLYEYKDSLANGYAIFSVKFRVTDPVTMLDEELNVVE